MTVWNLDLIREDLRSLRRDLFETYRFKVAVKVSYTSGI